MPLRSLLALAAASFALYGLVPAAHAQGGAPMLDPYDVDYRSAEPSGTGGSGPIPPPSTTPPPPVTPAPDPAPEGGAASGFGAPTSSANGAESPGGPDGGMVGSLHLSFMPTGRYATKDIDGDRFHDDLHPALGFGAMLGGGGPGFSAGLDLRLSRLFQWTGKYRYVDLGLLLRPHFQNGAGELYLDIAVGLAVEVWKYEYDMETLHDKTLGMHAELGMGMAFGHGSTRPFLEMGLLIRHFPRYWEDDRGYDHGQQLIQMMIETGLVFGG